MDNKTLLKIMYIDPFVSASASMNTPLMGRFSFLLTPDHMKQGDVLRLLRMWRKNQRMKKLILVCLMVLTGSAWAEWVVYQKSEKVTQYYDPSTILKVGNMRQVWQLQNLGRSLQNGATSFRMLREYDCQNERWRQLAISVHTEPMGGGAVLETAGEDTNWNGIRPDTIAEVILELVCVKK